MAKISLAAKLQAKGELTSNEIVSTNLIEKMEVYGYVNSCQGDEMKLEDTSLYTTPIGYNNYVNCQTAGDIVCAHYLMQLVMTKPDGGIAADMRYHQIYTKIDFAKESFTFNLAELDVPSLYYHPAYRRIRRRKSNARLSTTDEKNARKLFPTNIQYNGNNEFEYTSRVGDILCRDIDGTVKGIGDHIMTVCRYLAPLTGKVCYAQFDLEEVFVEE